MVGVELWLDVDEHGMKLMVFGWTQKKLLAGGNSNILYFHPYLGKISDLTNIFQLG